VCERVRDAVGLSHPWGLAAGSKATSIAKGMLLSLHPSLGQASIASWWQALMDAARSTSTPHAAQHADEAAPAQLPQALAEIATRQRVCDACVWLCDRI